MAKRLIDGDKARAVLMNIAEHLAEAGNTELAGALGAAAEIIGKQRTVPAVEVIRCRNCIHDGLSTCPMCYIEGKTLVFVNHDPDFYCGKGERKGGQAPQREDV